MLQGRVLNHDSEENFSTHQSPRVSPQSQHRSQTNRRYNLVISGIKEHPAGTARATRISQDTNEVFTILSSLLTTFNESSTRDSYRLGRFSLDRFVLF